MRYQRRMSDISPRSGPVVKVSFDSGGAGHSEDATRSDQTETNDQESCQNDSFHDCPS